MPRENGARYLVRKVRTLHQLDRQGRQDLFRKIAGFGAVGVFNTLIGIGLQFLFLKVLGTPLEPTYVALWVFGIWLGYQLNTRLVFKAERNRQRLVKTYLVYGTAMLIGLGLLQVFKVYLPLETLTLETRNFLYSLLTLPLTMVWNFVGTAVVLRSQSR